MGQPRGTQGKNQARPDPAKEPAHGQHFSKLLPPTLLQFFITNSNHFEASRPLVGQGPGMQKSAELFGGLSNIIWGGEHAHIVISTIGIIAELHILAQPRAMLNLQPCKKSPWEVGWAGKCTQK